MPLLMYHLAGGDLFLPGVLALLMTARIQSMARKRWLLIVSRVAMILAVAVIAVSAEALPWWFYSAWALALVVWITRGFLLRRSFRQLATVAWLTATLLAGWFGLNYRIARRLPPRHFTRLYVIGDSITAGMGRAGETTWPTLLRRKHAIEIIDCSKPGCTVRQALHIIDHQAPIDGIVLLEIGGNDVIGSTPARQFGSDLQKLVRSIHMKDRPGVMFELPLFPFTNAYGVEQRRVAKEENILLIPRRKLTDILTTPGTTLDGIHLTNAGQQLLADLIWQTISPD